MKTTLYPMLMIFIGMACSSPDQINRRSHKSQLTHDEDYQKLSPAEADEIIENLPSDDLLDQEFALVSQSLNQNSDLNFMDKLDAYGANKKHHGFIAKIKKLSPGKNLVKDYNYWLFKLYRNYIGAKTLKRSLVNESEVLDFSQNDPQSKILLAHIKFMESTSAVSYLEANRLISSYTLPNDPFIEKNWGIKNIGQTVTNRKGKENKGTPGVDINVESAWNSTKGSKSVLVGIADSGIDYNHEDLQELIWNNPGETGKDSSGKDRRTNGVDDDKNGYVDDWRGVNFKDDQDPSDTMDRTAHGSHVAGIISSQGNNAKGSVGVNWQSSLVSARIFDQYGNGDLIDLANGIYYLANLKVDVINLSVGFTGFSQTVNDALKYCLQKGIPVVAAAGNNGINVDTLEKIYPAAADLDNIISVASLDENNKLSDFSNFGNISVDLAAPGHQIYSVLTGGYPYSDKKYALMSGTSMAAPFVTGAIALLKSYNKKITAPQLKKLVLDNVTPIDSSQQRLLKTGGRLNVGKAMAEAVRLYKNEQDVPMKTSQWTNPKNRYDVNNDGYVTPLDALVLTNALESGLSKLSSSIKTPYFYDVNGDGYVSPLDTLIVINYIEEH